MQYRAPRYADTPTVEVDAIIEAPPARVWEFVADPEAHAVDAVVAVPPGRAGHSVSLAGSTGSPTSKNRSGNG